MGKYLLLATSGVREGRQEEFDTWYDTVHLRDVCAVPGVTSGRRFVVHPASPNQPPVPNLAIYEIETDDPVTILAELGKRAQSGEMVISPALDPVGSGMTIFTPV